MGVNSLPKTVTRQRRVCDLNPGLLRLSPALGYRATRSVNRRRKCAGFLGRPFPVLIC